MSSMFKKKGGLAFKPKIPSSRSRGPTTTTKHVEDTPVEESTTIITPNDKEVHIQPEAPVVEQDVPVEEQPLTRSRRRSSVASNSSRTSGRRLSLATISAIDARAVEPEVSDQPAPIASKRQSRRTRQQSITAETEAESTPIVPPSATNIATPPPTQTRTRRRSTVAVEPAETQEAASTDRPPKRTRSNADTAQNDAPTTTERKKRGSIATNGDAPKPRAPRRARSLTPEDSETQVVDLQKLKMSDLTKDLHIGKKFSRHDELRERERQARIRAKLEKSEMGDSMSRSSTPLNERKLGASTPNSTAGPTVAPPSGPQFRIVDGQIVVDQSSLVMDRHARAAAAQAGEDMETIEENDFTRLITSSSFMNTSKLRGPNIWTDQETEMFYKGLRMLGTDFEMISQMIPGKQRRHVKLKFNREERHNPQRITAALVGEKTVKIDIDEYQAATGSEFEAVEAIEAEQRKVQETYEAEQQRVVDEQAEIMRKRREELFADEDEKGKKRGKKKGKQQGVQYGLNGEPIS